MLQLQLQAFNTPDKKCLRMHFSHFTSHFTKYKFHFHHQRIILGSKIYKCLSVQARGADSFFGQPDRSLLSFFMPSILASFSKNFPSCFFPNYIIQAVFSKPIGLQGQGCRWQSCVSRKAFPGFGQ